LEGQVSALDGDTLVFDAQGLGRLTLPVPAEPPAPGAATLAFRPHQIRIAAEGEPADADRVWLQGRVEAAEFLGEFARYRVRVGEVALVADQPHYAGGAMFPPGAQVRLGLAPTQLRYLHR
jgi:iron(III) transport system ATP-binding protein